MINQVLRSRGHSVGLSDCERTSTEVRIGCWCKNESRTSREPGAAMFAHQKVSFSVQIGREWSLFLLMVPEHVVGGRRFLFTLSLIQMCVLSSGPMGTPRTTTVL